MSGRGYFHRAEVAQILLLLCLACLRIPCFAQDVQTRAETLLARARQLSNIRSPNAPPFQLQATFSFAGENLKALRGRYTEDWASSSQWRREIVVEDLHYIAVAGSSNEFLLFPDQFPVRAEKLPTLMLLLPHASATLTFASISEHRQRKLVAECVLTKSPSFNRRFALCFEKETGLLLEKVFPDERPRNVVLFSCEYGSFQKFGAFWFPRRMACYEDGHKVITARVVKLTFARNPDPALFAPPAGAIEIGACDGVALPPSSLGREIPSASDADPDRIAWATVWFVVDAEGRAHNLKVLTPHSQDSYKDALMKIARYQFRPGECDGKPIALPMIMEVPTEP